jgi:RND family efflux transporter MFP subunit
MAVLGFKAPRAAEEEATAGTAAAAERRRRFPWLWLLLLAAVPAAVIGGAWLALRPLPVKTALVGRGEAVDAVYASGVVEYVRQARVAPVVTAPIRRVLVEEGQAVRAGQALAELDSGPQAGIVLQLEAQAAMARAGAERQNRLRAAGFAAEAAYEDAQKQRAAAEAVAASARERLDDYRIAAPFAGRVLRRDAEPGDLASVGRPMFVIADVGALRITADIDERDVGRLAPGQEAVVRADAFPGRTFAATITEITPQGDATGRVFRARLRLPSDSLLKPGMTVEANLVTARRPQAVLAPAGALKDDAVWVARDGRAHRRTVATGAKGADRIEIRRGLQPGESVILDPPAGLKENARVTTGR